MLMVVGLVMKQSPHARAEVGQAMDAALTTEQSQPARVELGQMLLVVGLIKGWSQRQSAAVVQRRTALALTIPMS